MEEKVGNDANIVDDVLNKSIVLNVKSAMRNESVDLLSRVGSSEAKNTGDPGKKCSKYGIGATDEIGVFLLRRSANMPAAAYQSIPVCGSTRSLRAFTS